MSHRKFYRCPCYVSGPGNNAFALLSTEGWRGLRFHQKYLNLCSEDEQRCYRFGTTRGWVINVRIFIFGWTNPLMLADHVKASASQAHWESVCSYISVRRIFRFSCTFCDTFHSETSSGPKWGKWMALNGSPYLATHHILSFLSF